MDEEVILMRTIVFVVIEYLDDYRGRYFLGEGDR